MDDLFQVVGLIIHCGRGAARSHASDDDISWGRLLPKEEAGRDLRTTTGPDRARSFGGPSNPKPRTPQMTTMTAPQRSSPAAASERADVPQYSLRQIGGVWLAAAPPVGLLARIGAPAARYPARRPH